MRNPGCGGDELLTFFRCEGGNVFFTNIRGLDAVYRIAVCPLAANSESKDAVKNGSSFFVAAGTVSEGCLKQFSAFPGAHVSQRSVFDAVYPQHAPHVVA